MSTPTHTFLRQPPRPTRRRPNAQTLPLFSTVPPAWLLLLLVVVAGCPPVNGKDNRQPACQPPKNSTTPLCKCQTEADGFMIQCNDRTPKLTRIPSGLPEDITVLSLTNNAITAIMKTDLIRVEKLRTVFLQLNSLAFIEDGAFDTLYSLKLLVLSDNSLTFIKDTWFRHMPSIQTIDLTNNQIVTVDRRAFLTLPASTFTTGVEIKLNNNPLQCGCQARALRDWILSLDSRVSPIRLIGFQCPSGDMLTAVRDEDFTCTGSVPPLFEDSPDCNACNNQQTHHTCDSMPATCGSLQAVSVCQSYVKMSNGRLSLYKSCGTYTDCLLRSRSNHRLCNTSLSSPSPSLECTFCCTGPVCNWGDMGGRTSSFKLYVGLRLNREYRRYMGDPQDSRYRQKANIFIQILNGVFQTVDGGYFTTFLNFRNDSNKAFVTYLVYVTTLNIYEVPSVITMMASAINTSMTSTTSDLYKQGVTYAAVGTELVSISKCPQEVSGGVTWPETTMRSMANASCPFTPAQGFARRACAETSSGMPQWLDPDFSGCQQSGLTGRLSELNSTVITPSNVNAVLAQLQQLTSEGGEGLTAVDVTLSVDVLERSLSQGGGLEDSTAMGSSLQVVSNVLGTQSSTLVQADRTSRAATRLLAVADRIGAEGKLGSDGQLLLTAPRVAVGAVAVDPANFQGASLTARTATDLAFEPGDVQIQPNLQSPGKDVNSLVLPPTLLTSTPASRIAMKALTSDKIFTVIGQSSKTGPTVSGSESDDDRRVKVNSHVLDATVVGHEVSNLADPVTMTFVHLSENASDPSCVFWDVGRRQWSSEGCTLALSLSSDNSSTCQCSHLTNFALLMDVYGAGGVLSEADKKALSIISYIGCGLSLLALLLTLLTYSLFKNSYGSWSLSEEKLRRDNPSKILVNLCVALTLSNLVFVAGMQPYALDNLIGCKVVAVLLHFSLLSALCWMAVEAFYMYLALVLVFKTYFTNFILKCSLIGWGIPLLTVAITLGVNETDNYGPLSTGVCWLKGLSFYIAFLAPVCLILLLNFVAFGLVVRQIVGMGERKLHKSDSFSVGQQLRGAVGVAILLGLTWVFALFAIDRASVVFYYLFAIFNSLQGLWIFVFYCLLKKEARSAWKRALPCCPTLDDKSIMSNTRDKHDQYSNSRSGYSGAVTKGRSKSSTDNGVTNTAFTTTSMDSEGAFGSEHDNSSSGKANKNENQSTPTAAIQSNEIHIKLTEPEYQNQTWDNAQPAPSSDAPATAPSGSQQSSSDPQPLPQEGRSLKPGGAENPAASPRSLHFKAGYTLSNTSTHSTQSQSDADGDHQPSVAELIKKMNNTKL
ncbi:uncharacterized protein LOC143283086 isoform X3 [Babylonia areolata]|uniref:uncharacterized protein LOC143283086 isoform X3 n=1 Tax=Babylonia areolata TaxID=304850 RepID=UPI003FD59848